MPDMAAGHCLGPERNGVSLGEGGERGPGPTGGREDKQSVISEGRGNMEKEEEEWREQSELFLQDEESVINVNYE